MSETKQILFQSFIDLELWDKARWRATAFMHDLDGIEPPLIGIAFEDIESGRKIFEGWRNRLGEVDRYNELRIAIIEGEILGETPGYSLHISSDPLNTEKRALAEGNPLDFDAAILVTRMQRMTPSPGFPLLANFKHEFAKHQKYSVVPVSMKSEPQFDLAIEKSVVHLRQASEVTKSDLDSAVFPPGYFDGDGTIH